MSDKRTIISMPEALRERVRIFRFARQINTEAEAIRVLLEKGLDADEQSRSEGGKSTPI